jgi:tetratricopeptide (TPR) repeat protein
MQAQIQQQLEPLVGLKLSIARRAASMRNFHFGKIRLIERGSIGEYALHIQCPWRIDSMAGIVTGSQDLWHWAFGEHEPLGWDFEDGNSLQDVRLGELLKGYDKHTESYVNMTDKLVVESIQASPFSDVSLFLSGGYRLILFPTSLFGESWRLFRPDDDTSIHFVVGLDFAPDPLAASAGSESVILSMAPHHRAALCYARGRALETRGDLTGAADQLTQAIELSPSFASAYLERARVYQSQGEEEHALADMDEAIRLNREHHREYYEMYCLRGNLHMDLDDITGAILDLSQAISLYPNGSRAYFLRAAARALTSDLPGAIEDFSEVIGIRPQDANAYDSRGDIYRQQGNLEQALADFCEAIRISPSEWLFYYHRGLTWATKGDIAYAIRDYRQALGLWPDNQPDETKNEMLDFIATHTNLP